MKRVQKILFSWGEKPLNHAQFAPCPPSIFRHSRQANSAFSGPKFRAGGPKCCTGPLICTSSKFCLVLDLLNHIPYFLYIYHSNHLPYLLIWSIIYQAVKLGQHTSSGHYQGPSMPVMSLHNSHYSPTGHVMSLESWWFSMSRLGSQQYTGRRLIITGLIFSMTLTVDAPYIAYLRAMMSHF